MLSFNANGAKAKTAAKSTVPVKKNNKNIPTAKPQSPIRLITIAFNADLFA